MAKFYIKRLKTRAILSPSRLIRCTCTFRPESIPGGHPARPWRRCWRATPLGGSPSLSRLLGSPRGPLNEFLHREGQIAPLIRAALAQLMGHVLRHVPRPTFGGVEANDTNRVVTLAVQQ